MTRGDGGQNLIGPELGEQLGVIRTQELLAARRIDHGQQFFTRANDFGFSKSSAETLRIWDREKILARHGLGDSQFPPRRDRHSLRARRRRDARTSHRLRAAGEGSFHAAADPKRFPEQLKFVQPWQATRLLWNTSAVLLPRAQHSLRSRGPDPDRSGRLSAAARQILSRRSPPAAAPCTRARASASASSAASGQEYFKLLDGKPLEGGDLFSGIDTTWARVPKAAG